jgi:hypothetical protein
VADSRAVWWTALLLRVMGTLTGVAFLTMVPGMPWWWTAFEGPAIIPFGILLLLLNRAAGKHPDR